MRVCVGFFQEFKKFYRLQNEARAQPLSVRSTETKDVVVVHKDAASTAAPNSAQWYQVCKG